MIAGPRVLSFKFRADRDYIVPSPYGEFGIGVDVQPRIGVLDLDGDPWEETAKTLRRRAAEFVAGSRAAGGGAALVATEGRKRK